MSENTSSVIKTAILAVATLAFIYLMATHPSFRPDACADACGRTGVAEATPTVCRCVETP